MATNKVNSQPVSKKGHATHQVAINRAGKVKFANVPNVPVAAGEHVSKAKAPNYNASAGSRRKGSNKIANNPGRPKAAGE